MSILATVTAYVNVTANGAVIVTPNPLDIATGPVAILYQLLNKDYVFPPQQAVVVADPGTTFPLPSSTIAPRLASLYDTVDTKGDFHYTVTVQHATTGQQLRVDPTIRNES